VYGLSRLRRRPLERPRSASRPLPGLGRMVSPVTVWAILRKARFDPAPERTDPTWAQFLKAQASGILACDFFQVKTIADD
jgi:putative transposase